MREIFAALQSRFAKLHGFDKTGFLREIPANRLLRERIGVTASLGGEFRKLVLLIRREMYFHKRQCRGTNWTCQRWARRVASIRSVP